MAFRFNAPIVVICLQIICLELVLAKTSITFIKESTDKIVEPVSANQFHEDNVNVDLNKNPNHGGGNNVTVAYIDKISDSSNGNEVNINATSKGVDKTNTTAPNVEATPTYVQYGTVTHDFNDYATSNQTELSSGQLQVRVKRNAERQRQLAERIRKEKAEYATKINAIKEKYRKAEEDHQAFVKRVKAGIELAKTDMIKYQKEYEETKRKRMKIEG